MSIWKQDSWFSVIRLLGGKRTVAQISDDGKRLFFVYEIRIRERDPVQVFFEAVDLATKTTIFKQQLPVLTVADSMSLSWLADGNLGLVIDSQFLKLEPSSGKILQNESGPGGRVLTMSADGKVGVYYLPWTRLDIGAIDKPLGFSRINLSSQPLWATLSEDGHLLAVGLITNELAIYSVKSGALVSGPICVQ